VSNLPAVTGKQLTKSLRKIGFEVVRSKSSHHFLQRPDGRRTVVPVHTGETIGRRLLVQIIRDCEITSEDLKKVL
jgi:predicted RNA binding protein YcfA (HicA-like mRNA interferase family)